MYPTADEAGKEVEEGEGHSRCRQLWRDSEPNSLPNTIICHSQLWLHRMKTPTSSQSLLRLSMERTGQGIHTFSQTLLCKRSLSFPSLCRSFCENTLSLSLSLSLCLLCSHLVTAHPGPLLSDILLSSPILTDEEGAPLVPLGQGFEFGIDPTEDPELAMVCVYVYVCAVFQHHWISLVVLQALRVSMEEQRQRQEEEVRRATQKSTEEPPPPTTDTGTHTHTHTQHTHTHLFSVQVQCPKILGYWHRLRLQSFPSIQSVFNTQTLLLIFDLHFYLHYRPLLKCQLL